ncbi:t-SNARE [Infundibulicybe gibba]|nr:t-SNARE [Infundibulicybe gibba]
MPSDQGPTTRSRTGLFLSYRDSISRFSRSRRKIQSISYEDDDDPQADEHQGLIHTSHSIQPDPQLPPKWVDISDQVERVLAGAQAKISSLDKMHAKHVLPGFSDRSYEEREIEDMTTDITRDFRQCHALIQQIGMPPQATHTFPPISPAHHEALTAKNVQRALAAKVQDLSAAFRKKQRVYMEKLQGHTVKTPDIILASTPGDAMSALEEDVRAAADSQHQSQAFAQATPSHDLQTRTHELTEIAHSIGALAELFKDLAVLVIDQGTLLDSVEYNIEQTAAHVGEAVKELEVATQYQRNTGRRWCIFLLMLCCIGLVLVLVFKPRRSAGGGTAPAAAASETPIKEGEQLMIMMRGTGPIFRRWKRQRGWV